MPTSGDVPHSLPCEKCGQSATVVRSQSRHGEQLVLARIDGKLFATVDCPQCGKGHQEVELTPPGK